ncbi:uncharacterized protein PHALS_10653 [Plasmopara halstedii]|uniref:Uncharacterized protein n=1 Tax=Plasmopara halstedii TaxID=4781 RepID=A0A0P1AIS3_PLAHL|nr:uncharacterized protein PHALS_10653 [Plasmopara halstedii]CEG40454.1 hypothetical protein PHALS_10653 [Plasmopara halstedii]|eukprot:XP_024576823.1 hypothetical protein PHALS_10653 [Plasmopara halstedii]
MKRQRMRTRSLKLLAQTYNHLAQKLNGLTESGYKKNGAQSLDAASEVKRSTRYC